jgi:hypothetical protein
MSILWGIFIAEIVQVILLILIAQHLVTMSD